MELFSEIYSCYYSVTSKILQNSPQFITGDYLPYRLEYSQKNDRFRIYVTKMNGTKPLSLGTINLSRIYHIYMTDKCLPGSC
ncbi:hypothetical protein [Lachnoclostridium phytofermentans]|uniref:hypothetical protein n=1 Tax=Lachnoclostridium phytofermentans TaxID=66219 RepID=UPI0000D80C6B|nr:hypothetical protein [Lachnoclostridium phytofermentans]